MNTIFFLGGEEASHYLSLVGDRSVNLGKIKWFSGRTGGEISCHLQSITGGGGL